MRLQLITGWWLLVPLIVAGLGYLAYLVIRDLRNKISPQLLYLRRLALLVLLLFMVVGISVPGGSTSPGVANLDVVFAVDTTGSMGAIDYKDGRQRLQGAKSDMLAIGKKLNGAHFSIVTFDSNVETVLPFTADYNTFSAVVENLNPEIYNTSNGSSIDMPLDQLKQQLSASKAAYPDHSRITFYLSDGEQTSKKPVKSFSDLKNRATAGAVLGYGTSKGAKMVKYTGLAQDSKSVLYIQTPDATTKKFVPATSKLDEGNLRKIADQSGLTYANRNQAGSIDKLFKASSVDLAIDKSRHVTHFVNIYWLFAIPFAALLLWDYKRLVEETVKSERVYRAHKKEQTK